MKQKSLLILTATVLSGLPFYSGAQVYTGVQDALPVQLSLGGNVKYDGWYNLSSQPKDRTVGGQDYTIPGNSGYPNSPFAAGTPWTNPMLSQFYSATGHGLSTPDGEAGSPSARVAFTKIRNQNQSGGLDKFNSDGTLNGNPWGTAGTFAPYPAGDSIYAISFSNNYNAFGGTLGVFDANPLAGLQTVVLQLEIGAANGYDFYDSTVSGPLGGLPDPGEGPLPVVPFGSVNNQAPGLLDSFTSWAPVINLVYGDSLTATLVADYAALLNKGYNGTAIMPTGPGGADQEEDIWVNLYGFQWDLSGYEDILSYNISWDVVEHSQFYALQLDQGDSFAGNILGQYVIPEPGVYAAFFGGIGLIGIWIRRRKNRSAA